MFKIVDEVVSEASSQFIFEKCANLKWTFVPDISLGSEAKKNVPGFSCNFFLHKNFNNNEPKDIITPEYDYMSILLLECFNKLKLNIPLDAVFRSRARLTLPRPELSEEDRIDNPHIDYKIPHLVLIYYVNSTDGDTLFFEQGKIVERISPKRNRCVIFDGNRLHSSSTPTLSPRIIINNNIKI